MPQPIAEAIDGCVSGRQPWPLVLTGPAGIGKTAAGLCVLDLFGSRRMYTAWELAMVVRDARCGDPGAERQLWRDIANFGCVLLDDIGSRERVSDSQYDAVKLTLDTRHGAPLVVTSNLHIKQLLDVYDDRITSRLAAGTCPSTRDLRDMRIRSKAGATT